MKRVRKKLPAPAIDGNSARVWYVCPARLFQKGKRAASLVSGCP
jgi:hypothetical protein